jgi:MarR-like DNA-binding transcriptional regulator SgrR of sgrS sRNA
MLWSIALLSWRGEVGRGRKSKIEMRERRRGEVLSRERSQS